MAFLSLDERLVLGFDRCTLRSAGSEANPFIAHCYNNALWVATWSFKRVVAGLYWGSVTFQGTLYVYRNGALVFSQTLHSNASGYQSNAHAPAVFSEGHLFFADMKVSSYDTYMDLYDLSLSSVAASLLSSTAIETRGGTHSTGYTGRSAAMCRDPATGKLYVLAAGIGLVTGTPSQYITLALYELTSAGAIDHRAVYQQSGGSYAKWGYGALGVGVLSGTIYFQYAYQTASNVCTIYVKSVSAALTDQGTAACSAVDDYTMPTSSYNYVWGKSGPFNVYLEAGATDLKNWSGAGLLSTYMDTTYNQFCLLHYDGTYHYLVSLKSTTAYLLKTVQDTSVEVLSSKTISANATGYSTLIPAAVPLRVPNTSLSRHAFFGCSRAFYWMNIPSTEVT